MRIEDGERPQSLKGIRLEQCDHCPAPLMRSPTDFGDAAQTEKSADEKSRNDGKDEGQTIC